MESDNNSIVVDFPLRGEWTAPNTPGHKIPSHGTDQLGQRFAFDFIRIDWAQSKGYKFFYGSKLSYYLKGIQLKNCLGWSEPFFSPISGEVVEVADGHRERNPVHLIRDLFVVLKNAFTLTGKTNHDLIPAIGNYIIIQDKNNVFAFFAHARNGSIKVKKGDTVETGQQLGEVGHSGNSTAPHLHFHLMDSKNLLEAKGISCCFKNYEVLTKNGWQLVEKGIPNIRARIRSI